MQALLSAGVILAVAGFAMAVEAPSMETGKILFESSRLGSNGRSCAGCHPQGKGLSDSVYLDETELIELINICISRPLAGDPLAPSSTEMASLALFIRSLSSGVR